MSKCSVSSADAGEALIGTAPSRDGYLLIEARFPWKHDILDSKDLLKIAPILTHANVDGKPLKIFLVGYDSAYSKEGFRRVVLLRKDVENKKFIHEEYFLPLEREGELLPLLFENKEQLQAYKGCALERIIVVCVDGGHDKCCGLKGQPLYRSLRQRYTKDVQVLQASHIGGHRFAPTCIDFPEGRAWGRIEESRLEDIFEKRASFSEVSHMYRGNGFLNQKEQYVEKCILEEYGWNADANIEQEGERIKVTFDRGERVEYYSVSETSPVLAFGSCEDPEPTSFIKYAVRKLYKKL